ncbi:DinB family protein [Streptomyces sp. NPDC089424]|uniref:DinB family protein n=1 Tax=Streptomyces sp. NPDC089424 TaxID=3365917 RepID=UPI0038169BA3
MTAERISPPTVADERTMLRAHLDFHRQTLELKCAGLSDAQLRIPSVAPSTLSLLALVRHMAEVERAWFRRVLHAEHDLPLVWSDTFDFQAAYETADAKVSEAFAAWRAEVGHARRIESAAGSLELVAHEHRRGIDVSLRWVMLHMIHEYARHNGHADFLRESIDGTTGV